MCDVSCLSRPADISTHLRFDLSISVTWLIYMCAMTYSYMWRDLFVWDRLVYMCDMTHSSGPADISLSMCEMTFSCVCDVTHSYVCRDSFISATWLIRRCEVRNVTRSYAWQRIWLSHATHVTSHIWMRHVTKISKLCHTYEWVMSRRWVSHVTHMNESCRKVEWVVSHVWMRCVRRMNIKKEERARAQEGER